MIKQYGNSVVANSEQVILENFSPNKQENISKNSIIDSLKNKNQIEHQAYTEVHKNEEYNNTGNNHNNNKINSIDNSDFKDKLNQSKLSKKTKFKSNMVRNKAEVMLNIKFSDSNDGFINGLYFEGGNKDQILNINENNDKKAYVPIKYKDHVNLNARKRNSLNQDSVLVLERFNKKFKDYENRQVFKSSQSIVELKKINNNINDCDSEQRQNYNEKVLSKENKIYNGS